jgi:hypothetical protein
LAAPIQNATVRKSAKYPSTCDPFSLSPVEAPSIGGRPTLG